MKWEYLRLKVIAFLYLIVWEWDIGAFVSICKTIDIMEIMEGELL